jgi:hypothetical protein
MVSTSGGAWPVCLVRGLLAGGVGRRRQARGARDRSPSSSSYPDGTAGLVGPPADRRLPAPEAPR